MLSKKEKQFRKVLANNIKLYRKETQEIVSEKAEFSIDALSKTEREETTISAYNLLKLANAIETTPNHLLRELISNEEMLVEDELWREMPTLDTGEKKFLLDVINFMKTHRKK